MTAEEFGKWAFEWLGRLGGVAAIAAGLAVWLGNVWAGRILEKQKTDNAKELERMKQEHAERLRELNAKAARDLEAEKMRLQEDFERVRRESTRELQLLQAESARLVEQLRSELSRQTYVHSLQFKREFEIYSELWPSLLNVRQAAQLLRSYHSDLVAGHTVEHRDTGIAEWRTVSARLCSSFQAHAPFIPQRVADKIQNLTDAIEQLGHQSLRGQTDQEYWDAVVGSDDKLAAAVDEAISAIRSRIGLFDPPAAN